MEKWTVGLRNVRKEESTLTIKDRKEECTGGPLFNLRIDLSLGGGGPSFGLNMACGFSVKRTSSIQ